MNNFDVSKIQLLSIIDCINEYTDDPAIIIPCRSLKEELEEGTMTPDVLKFCTNTMYEWYQDNLNDIATSKYVSNKDSHFKNLNTLREIKEDITENFADYVKQLSSAPKNSISASISGTDIFIVHGRDETVKNEVARFLEKLKLKPIILHEQSNNGDTIIEKIEKYTNVGYGIVLYTPCDVGALLSEKDNLNNRARQNVVFEHGFLIGKLSRKKVCALVKGDIEKPNDLSGVVYINYNSDGGWKLSLAKELKEAGYNINLNSII